MLHVGCSMLMLLIHISLLRGTIRDSMLDISELHKTHPTQKKIEIKVKTAAGIYFINNCLWIVRVFIFFSSRSRRCFFFRCSNFSQLWNIFCLTMYGTLEVMNTWVNMKGDGEL